MLPNHIIDLACSLEEQAVDDNDIIRWCMRLMDNPREASRINLFLAMSDRDSGDIRNQFEKMASITGLSSPHN